MQAAPYRIRRATVDDLAQLKALWQAMAFTTPDLDKRLTEFQVAVTAEGRVIGAVGLQIASGHGLIHSEAFTDFSLADEVRPLLWERLQAIAANYGLFRLWTREAAPFWGRCGLLPASEELLPRLPEPWRAQASRWMTLQLREETAATISVEREFDLFMAAERQRTRSALDQARTLKTIATVLAVGLAAAVLTASLYFLLRNPQGLTP